jgi:two-component system cell cycle sensor histidine kinase/response regulator CckA
MSGNRVRRSHVRVGAEEWGTASDNMFGAILLAANDSIIILKDGINIECNLGAEQMFQCGRENIINIGLEALSPMYQPDSNVSREKAARLMQLALNGEPQRFEWVFKRFDGVFIHCEVSMNRVDIAGESYLPAVIRDMTEKKHAEESLRESEKKLRTLFNNASDAIFLITAKGEFIDSNPSASELFRCDKEELLAKNPLFFSPPFQPDGRDSIEKARKLFTEARQGVPQRFEWRHRRKDGAEFDAIVVLNRFELEGEIILQAIVRDISARKKAENELRESEARFRELADMLPEVVFESDLTGKLTYANKDAFTKYGYAEEELQLGIFISQLVIPEDRDRLRNAIAEKMTLKNEDPYGGEYTTVKKDGTRIPVIVYSKPIISEGRPVGLRGIVVDITERKSLEAQLYQAQKMEAVGQLAGGVAHDFNNILTAIIGYSHILMMKMTNGDPLRGFVGQIRVSAERAAELTQALLAFSRKQIMLPRAIDLNEVAAQLQKMLRRLIRENIYLNMGTVPGKLTVMADWGKLEQVLMNLVTNANDAMPQGGTLSISTSSVTMNGQFLHSHGYGEPGKYACIAVSDTGSGMDEATRKRIFEPFFTTKEVGKGTGLGLSIVYGIVKQHNGYVSVYSELGKGTSFRIYLPLVERKAERYQETDNSVTLPGGTETLLLVEDDPVVCCFHRTLLEEAGYTVITAVDGEDALERFNEHESDIVLLILDVIMPKMNGKKVFGIIRKGKPDIKALFISGYSTDVLSDAGAMQEAAGFMMKPVDPGKFLKKVREVLDS